MKDKNESASPFDHTKVFAEFDKMPQSLEQLVVIDKLAKSIESCERYERYERERERELEMRIRERERDRELELHNRELARIQSGQKIRLALAGMTLVGALLVDHPFVAVALVLVALYIFVKA